MNNFDNNFSTDLTFSIKITKFDKPFVVLLFQCVSYESHKKLKMLFLRFESI